MELQSFLRKMKKLDANGKKVRYRKSRRLLLRSIATTVTVFFMVLLFADNTAVPMFADAGSETGGALEEITLQNRKIAGNTEVKRIAEEKKILEAVRAYAASDFLDIERIWLISGVVAESEGAGKDLLEIFGERDWLLDEDIFAEKAVGDSLYAEGKLNTGNTGLLGNIHSRGIAAGDGPDEEKASSEDTVGADPSDVQQAAVAEEDGSQKMETREQMDEKAFYASIDYADIPPQLNLSYNAQYCINLSAEQRKVLETIVEAEAGDEDAYGKILVANVVLNRVLADEFPDTVKEVVFQNNGKTYQFSPVRSGGRYYTVTVSKSTKEAVARALNGEDYSEGALYFFARRYTSTAKAHWFDTALKKIVEYGCHEFFGNK